MSRRVVLAPVLALVLVSTAACRAGRQAATSALELPQACPHGPRPGVFDVLAYAIDVELLPEERSIRAECRVRLRPLAREVRTVELDLVGLRVDGVRDEHGHELAFTRDDGRLAIRLAR